MDPIATVDDLVTLLARGARVRDEPELDGLAHALQCAAILRAEHPDDSELALAGLVHDISDIAHPDDHTDHDHRGAALVEPLLGRRVARLVGAHVLAKRYLVTTDPAYRSRLSVRSIETLSAQGAYAEFGYCTISPMWAYANPKRVAEAVNAIGARHCLLVSDTGQRHNPMPAEALRVFAQSLFESGVTEEDVSTMIRANPMELLDLPAEVPVVPEAVAP